MRVGLEVSSLALPYPTGIARYMTSLAKAISTECPDDRFTLWYRLSRLKHRRYWQRPAGLATRVWQGRWWPPLPGVDLFHGLDGVVPERHGIPKVATLHDLAVLHPLSPDAASNSFRQRKLERHRAMARVADRVIVPSQATRHDAVNLLELDESRIRVIPHGVEERFLNARPQSSVQQRYGLNDGYLLYVGVVSERKNTERLVRAFARSSEAAERQLMLAGRDYHRSNATRAAVRELDLGDRVFFADHVADRDLPALYAGADALVFPTLYEGFGLPILEAMAAGTPVLCADRGAAPEIAGGFAVTVDPTIVEAIAEGIDRVLSRPPAADDLKRHAGRFTWQRTAMQTANVYRELIAHD